MTHYLGAYSIPTPLACLHNLSNNSIHSFSAQVHQYHPVSTPLTLYLCSLSKITLTRSDNLFAAKEKHISSESIKSSPCLCKRAATHKQSPYGKLLPSGVDSWKTPSNHHYKCAWLKTAQVTFFSLSMTTYPASLQGMHMHIQQSLTVTRCRYPSFRCTPREKPLSTIIWPITSYRFSVYRSLGVFPVKRIQQFFLILQLGVGGSLILRTRNAHLLDTGYKLVTKLNGTYHAPPSFITASRSYTAKTRSNAQRDLGEGRLTQQLFHEHEIISQLASTLCTRRSANSNGGPFLPSPTPLPNTFFPISAN